MKRLIFNLAVWISLAMCILIVAASVRSMWIRDTVLAGDLRESAGHPQIRWRQLASERGRIGVMFRYQTFPGALSVLPNPEEEPIAWKAVSLAARQGRVNDAGWLSVAGGSLWQRWGVRLQRSDIRVAGNEKTPGGVRELRPTSYIVVPDVRSISVPYWAILALFGVLPLMKGRRVIALHRRRQRGLCPTCGYDLRASPERCPECGATVARA